MFRKFLFNIFIENITIQTQNNIFCMTHPKPPKTIFVYGLEPEVTENYIKKIRNFFLSNLLKNIENRNVAHTALSRTNVPNKTATLYIFFK